MELKPISRSQTTALFRQYLQYIGWKILLLCAFFLFLLPYLSFVLSLLFSDSTQIQTQSLLVIPRYLFNTILLLLVVIPISVLLASSVAWLCSMYRCTARKIIIVLQICPLFIPSFVSGISWKEGLGIRGMIHQFLSPIVPLGEVPNFVILCTVLIFKVYPYIFLILYSLFSSTAQALIDTARSFNTNKKSLFVHIGLAQARISIIGISIFIIMELLNEYWIYQYFGYHIISSGILRIWQLYGNLELAKILVLAIILLSYYLIRLRKKTETQTESYNTLQGKPVSALPLRTRHAVPAIALCLLPPLLGFVLPLVQQILWATKSIAQKQIPSDILTSLFHSFTLLFSSLSVIIVAAVLICYASRIWKHPLTITIISVLSLGYSIPNSTVGILFLSAIDFLDSLFPSLSLFSVLINRSLLALIAASVFRYLPLALIIIASGFYHQNACYEEASRSLGKGPFRTLFSICIPENYSYIVSAFLVCSVDILMDIPMTLVLHPFNFKTLALDIYFLVQDEFLYQSSVVSLVLIAFVTILIFPIYTTIIRKGPRPSFKH